MSGVELFALPPALGGGAVTLGTAATVVGTAFSAISAISSGNAARSAGDYNAALYAQNAQVTRQRAAADEARQRRLATQRMGANAAMAGASGVGFSGSVLDILESNAAQEELDALTIRWNGETAASGLDAQGALASAQGRNAQRQGYIGAGATLLLGGAKAADSLKYPVAAAPTYTPSTSFSMGFATPLQRR
jgi:hypothetical protein